MDLAGVGVGVGERGLAVGADALRQAVFRMEVKDLGEGGRKESMSLTAKFNLRKSAKLRNA